MAKVLLADDSKFELGLLSAAVAAPGLEIIVAQDAMQAWMLAVRNVPDLIVLDVNMPGGNGIEVLKRLKTSPKTRAIPVIVASGADEHIEKIARTLGAEEFLRKPIDVDQLRSVVQALLETEDMHVGVGAKPASLKS